MYNIVDMVQRISFNEIILRESHGFRELWDVDLPLENLPIRHRNAKFGWINRLE
jgi:hypothetical protein